MSFPMNTLLATGRARIQSSNPIAFQYDHLLMVAVIEKESGRILEIETDTICGLTSEFLNGIFVGKSLYTDQDAICAEIEDRYFGASRKALCSCVKDMYSKATNRIKD